MKLIYFLQMYTFNKYIFDGWGKVKFLYIDKYVYVQFYAIAMGI